MWWLEKIEHAGRGTAPQSDNNGPNNAQDDINMDMPPLEDVTDNEKFEERSRRPPSRSDETVQSPRRRDRKCRSRSHQGSYADIFINN